MWMLGWLLDAFRIFKKSVTVLYCIISGYIL